MSEFSDKKFSGENYANARPNYPPQLYEKLKQIYLANEKVKHVQDPVLVDLGCGPGTATFQFKDAEFLSTPGARYIGIDPSEKMISTAKENVKAKNLDCVDFKIGSEANFDMTIGDNDNVTVISAVQCCHWFDFPLFLNNAYKVLSRSRGNLFLFGYIKCKILEYPELDAIITDLDEGLVTGFGAYWDQPGRDYLSDLLRDDFFMKSLQESNFKNVKVDRFVIDSSRNPLELLDNDAISAEPYYYLYKRTTMSHFREYVTTWSAYNRCKREKGVAFADKLIEDAFFKCFKKIPGLGFHTEITVAWSTYVISADCA